MACRCVVCKRVACSCVVCSAMASRGRGHQISTTLTPSTERLVSILCKVNFLG